MIIPGALDGERLDRVVSLLCDLTRREAAALVAAGGVRLGSTGDAAFQPGGPGRRP